MKIVCTIRELMDRGVWPETSREAGFNEWALNEGLFNEEYEIELTEEQAAKIGLIRSEQVSP